MKDVKPEEVEVLPAEPDLEPDEVETPLPSEDDPFAIPSPKVNPTPKGRGHEEGEISRQKNVDN